MQILCTTICTMYVPQFWISFPIIIFDIVENGRRIDTVRSSNCRPKCRVKLHELNKMRQTREEEEEEENQDGGGGEKASQTIGLIKQDLNYKLS